MQYKLDKATYKPASAPTSAPGLVSHKEDFIKQRVSQQSTAHNGNPSKGATVKDVSFTTKGGKSVSFTAGRGRGRGRKRR